MTRLIMITSPRTGSGKTVFTLWLMMQARRRNLITRAVKLGPDYLDADLLSTASDRPVLNIDPWCMRPETQSHILESATQDCDLVVIEAMMGLHDGSISGNATPAELIENWNIPWLMIAAADGMGASLAYMLQGLSANMIPGCSGLILNRVSGTRHGNIIADALKRVAPSVPLCAGFGVQKSWVWPHRYLGLQQGNLPDRNAFAARLADEKPMMGSNEGIFETIDNQDDWTPDLCKVRKTGCVARSPSITISVPIIGKACLLPCPGQHIAVAQDRAFSFIYTAQIEQWKNNGSRVTFFSPLNNDAVPSNSDAIYIPGGYPERFLKQLTHAQISRDSIRDAAARGVLIYGECGGAAMLGTSICDQQATSYEVWNLLPMVIDYSSRQRTLGYRQVSTVQKSWLGPSGTTYRGHQFHYGIVSVSEARNAHAIWNSYDARGNLIGQEGLRIGNIFGTFVHVIDHT